MLSGVHLEFSPQLLRLERSAEERCEPTKARVETTTRTALAADEFCKTQLPLLLAPGADEARVALLRQALAYCGVSLR